MVIMETGMNKALEMLYSAIQPGNAVLYHGVYTVKHADFVGGKEGLGVEAGRLSFSVTCWQCTNM